MRAKLILSVVAASMLYLAGPLYAGLFGIGDREGPQIYSREYHTVLYVISYEMVRDEKPRVSIESTELNRPIFYGFPRTQRSR
ncbi:MAG TPA: hypothetical protein VJR02_21160 [Pyrinomonadaceae bacterium]|nr:hypothetical protein [Pyrinomonadaceae bacterium]